MKRSHWLLLTTVTILLTLPSLSRAGEFSSERATCRCIFNGTKDYQLYDETKSFFGQRKVHRKWTCEYACRTGSVTETVTGSYDLINHGDDDGREGICEGTIYESQFNPYVMREVYTYKSSETFSPKKAKAIELRQWAESQNCDR
jgi:hypothetical protein